MIVLDNKRSIYLYMYIYLYLYLVFGNIGIKKTISARVTLLSHVLSLSPVIPSDDRSHKSADAPLCEWDSPPCKWTIHSDKLPALVPRSAGNSGDPLSGQSGQVYLGSGGQTARYL